MSNSLSLKTSVDIARIRRSCKIIERTFDYLKEYIRPGISTKTIEKRAENHIRENGGNPAVRGFMGFPGGICVSVNNVMVHGKPNDYILEEGDIVTVDIVVEVNGWYGDGAWSYIVGSYTEDTLRLIRAAWQSTLAGITAVKPGKTTGEIGGAIEKTARKWGCSVARDFTGHGIGKDIHEEPIIPNYGKNIGQIIVPGMVFTVEPVVTLGSGESELIEDGFTIITKDGSLSAQYEHTVAVFRDYTEVLTFSKGKLTEYLDFPPFF